MKRLLFILLIFGLLSASGCAEYGESVGMVLNVENYDRVDFRLDQIEVFEKTFNVTNCTMKAENDTIIIECPPQPPTVRGFSGWLNLINYEKFYPCKPCSYGAVDCTCSCKTTFKKGLAWRLTAPGIMTSTEFFDANTGERFCYWAGA